MSQMQVMHFHFSSDLVNPLITAQTNYTIILHISRGDNVMAKTVSPTKNS